MHTLPLPDAVLRDDNSVHMLGAWIAEEGLHYTLNYGFFEKNGHDEAEAWGVMLADVIRHIANARKSETGEATASTMATIVASLQAELADPSSDAEGEFVSKPH